MEHSLHSSGPTAMIRPRGAHRFEVFSPKLSRRLTIYRRVVLDAFLEVLFVFRRNIQDELSFGSGKTDIKDAPSCPARRYTTDSIKRSATDMYNAVKAAPVRE
jgi:hypothetical protein